MSAFGVKRTFGYLREYALSAPNFASSNDFFPLLGLSLLRRDACVIRQVASLKRFKKIKSSAFPGTRRGISLLLFKRALGPNAITRRR
jgi:hypothetical protein